MATRKPKNAKTADNTTKILSKEDILKLKTKAYAEYERYMSNAKDALKKAGKKDGYYTDDKYTKTACNIAYSGVLVVLDAWIAINGATLKLSRGQRKSVDYYRENILRNRKLLNSYNTAYSILHLSGGYDGVLKYEVIVSGMSSFTDIAQFVKP